MSACLTYFPVQQLFVDDVDAGAISALHTTVTQSSFWARQLFFQERPGKNLSVSNIVFCWSSGPASVACSDFSPAFRPVLTTYKET